MFIWIFRHRNIMLKWNQKLYQRPLQAVSSIALSPFVWLKHQKHIRFVRFFQVLTFLDLYSFFLHHSNTLFKINLAEISYLMLLRTSMTVWGEVGRTFRFKSKTLTLSNMAAHINWTFEQQNEMETLGLSFLCWHFDAQVLFHVSNKASVVWSPLEVSTVNVFLCTTRNVSERNDQKNTFTVLF